MLSAPIDPLTTMPYAGDRAWPLHGVAQSRRIESWGIAAHPHMRLMERAGRSVARLAMAIMPPGCPVLVLTGAGHNGGDGWVAARWLHKQGCPVRVWEVMPAVAPDALAARTAALDVGVVVLSAPPWPLAGPGAACAAQLKRHGLLVVDALLGIGAREPLPKAVCAAIEWMVRAAATSPSVMVLSIDLPSGLHPDTGGRLACAGTSAEGGSCAVAAQHTLSLLTLKPGLFTHEGREHAGRVWFDDLGIGKGSKAGIPAKAAKVGKAGKVMEALAWPKPLAQLVPPALLAQIRSPRIQASGQPRQGGHKGSHGDVWLLGGALGMRGALRLAARAALASGAGRVHRVELDGVEPGHAEHGRTPPGNTTDRGDPTDRPGGIDELAPEVMTGNWHDLRQALDGDAVVVAGCGARQGIASFLPELLHRSCRLVLDADALNALARDTSLGARLRARSLRGQATVLTPHPLEAARMLACSTSEVQRDRLAAAQALADRSGATVVLKGSGSIVATPGCIPWINASGNARLATGGTGDVLAGWIGGAWLGLPKVEPTARSGGLHDLVAACVHLHGRAADRVDPSTGRCETAVLPASVLIGEMARELMRASHGHHG